MDIFSNPSTLVSVSPLFFLLICVFTRLTTKNETLRALFSDCFKSELQLFSVVFGIAHRGVPATCPGLEPVFFSPPLAFPSQEKVIYPASIIC